jgi:hypothetical protein
MGLKQSVDRILADQQRSLSWLADEMGFTFTGLKGSLVSESIKYSDLKKLIKVLNVPISILFEGDTVQIQKGGRYNTQASNSTINEPEVGYKKIEMEGLRKQVAILESSLKDKDEIIELLKIKHHGTAAG